MTERGGRLEHGTVYTVDISAPTFLAAFAGPLHDFTNTDGRPLGGLVEAADGNLYGTVGGPNGVFKMSYDGHVTYMPGDVLSEAPLIQATDGNFYVTTPGDRGAPFQRLARRSPRQMSTTEITAATAIPIRKHRLMMSATRARSTPSGVAAAVLGRNKSPACARNTMTNSEATLIATRISSRELVRYGRTQSMTDRAAVASAQQHHRHVHHAPDWGELHERGDGSENQPRRTGQQQQPYDVHQYEGQLAQRFQPRESAAPR